MTVDEMYPFDKWSLTSLAWIMVKHLDYSRVTIEHKERNEVQSQVWIEVTIVRETKPGANPFLTPGNIMLLGGQRPQIVRRKLIAFLDNKHPKPQP